jgi:hypothetical protein
VAVVLVATPVDLRIPCCAAVGSVGLLDAVGVTPLELRSPCCAPVGLTVVLSVDLRMPQPHCAVVVLVKTGSVVACLEVAGALAAGLVVASLVIASLGIASLRVARSLVVSLPVVLVALEVEAVVAPVDPKMPHCVVEVMVDADLVVERLVVAGMFAADLVAADLVAADLVAEGLVAPDSVFVLVVVILVLLGVEAAMVIVDLGVPCCAVLFGDIGDQE